MVPCTPHTRGKVELNGKSSVLCEAKKIELGRRVVAMSLKVPVCESVLRAD